MKNESGFTPNGDLVLVKPPLVEEKTAGGIIISRSTQEQEAKAARFGWIVAYGETAKQHDRMKDVEVGTMVLFSKYAGDFLPVEGIEYIVMRADNILGPMIKKPDYALNAAMPSAQVFGVNAPPKAA